MNMVRELVGALVLVAALAAIGLIDMLLGALSIWWAVDFHLACGAIVLCLIENAPEEPEEGMWG
jgi:hypothetical protein